MTQDRNGDRHLFGSHDRSTQFWLAGSRYALAIIATLVALATTLALKRVLPTSDFLFLIPGIAVSAWYGGRGPGILATALSLLVINYVIDAQVGSLRSSGFTDVLEVGAFIIKALIVVSTIEALRRARGLAESRAEKLEEVNEELRHALISRRLLAAHEAMCRRIAGLLHEDVGQLLTAVRLNLERLTVPQAGDGRVVGDSIGLVDEALKRVRDLSVELRPTVLDDLGLAEAVEWYANRQAERAGYAVVVEQELPEGRLPEPIETAAFRIVQQALTNIARHARAKNVSIVLRGDRQTVELAISDDGIGFDVQGARARSQAGESLGLVDMTELAYMVGGVLTVTSTEGKGSTVRVRFPLNSAQ